MRLVMELTDRCNLRCSYCFDGRHGGRGLMDETLFNGVLQHAAHHGIKELSFTGGEPTLHPQFDAWVERSAQAGYRYSLVTNGWAFQDRLPVLAANAQQLDGVTFSVDAADAATHDAQRGAGSWQRVIASAEACAARKLPFTFNMVLTDHNRSGCRDLARLAAQIGARGVRFIPVYQPARVRERTAESIRERARRDLELFALKATFAARDAAQGGVPGFAIGLAPGFYSDDPLSCHSLRGEEYNLDWRGNLGLCCHLSGHVRAAVPLAEDAAGSDPLAGLPPLQERRKAFVTTKCARRNAGELAQSDYFACDYCFRQWGQ